MTRQAGTAVRPSAGRRWVVPAVWLLSSALALGGLAAYHHAAMREQLAYETTQLAGQLAQRVDQHDAHLTGIAAVIRSGSAADDGLFEAVAGAIRTFYPRVSAVYWHTPADAGGRTLAVPREPSPSEFASTLAQALADTGNVVTLVTGGSVAPLRLVKKIPSAERVNELLVLDIDIPRLLGDPGAFWSLTGTGFALLAPSGETLHAVGATSLSTGVLQQQRVLNSTTQPLRLQAHWVPGLADWLPPRQVAAVLLGIAVLVGVGLVVHRLLAATRAAERRARLGEHEARIAHASRVNAIGELTSGIVHELTQPLTAILSQTQAAKRLMQRTSAGHDDDARALLGELLVANETQARRASAMLAHFRGWIRRSDDTQGTDEVVDLSDVIESVSVLLDSAVRTAGALLRVDIERDSTAGAHGRPRVDGDPVQLEQVVFNLVRNALDKRTSHTGDRLAIHLQCHVTGREVVLSVTDNGDPIDPALADRLTDPFVSGKPDGLGLGLALSDRIVTRLGGMLTLQNASPHGVVATVRLPLSATV